MRLEETRSTNSRPAEKYFHTGGAVPPDAQSYILREADTRLLQHLSGGTYCYILDSRQMGKTSLIGRAAIELRKAGTKVAIVDLTVCGENVTVDEWYRNQIARIGKGLGIEDDLEDFWDGQSSLGPVARYLEAMRFALKVIPGPGRIVIFVDEIDYVRTVSKNGFSTDELFAAIRGCFNARTHDPEMNRLTFCLLGTALPRDLISSPDTTPFNIGTRIDLSDFSEAEVSALGAGLLKPEHLIPVLVRRILYWTGGQPYLTQALSEAVSLDNSIRGSKAVDRLAAEQFLTPGRNPTVDDHYQQVSDRLLNERFRAENLSLYRELLRHRQLKRRFGFAYRLLFDISLLADDETKTPVNGLRLAGVAKGKGGLLEVRNELYAKRFNDTWIHENMLAAEELAAEKAYYRGLRYALLGAFSVVAVLALVGASIVIGKLEAEKTETKKVQAELRVQDDALKDALSQLNDALQRETDATKAAKEAETKEKKAHDRAEDRSSKLDEEVHLQKKTQDSLKVALEKEEKLTTQEAEVALENARLAKAERAEADKNSELEKEASAAKEALEAELMRQDNPERINASLSKGIDSVAKYATLQADQAIRKGLSLFPKKLASKSWDPVSGWYRVSGDGRYIATVGFADDQLRFERWTIDSPNDLKTVTLTKDDSARTITAALDETGEYLVLTRRSSQVGMEQQHIYAQSARPWEVVAVRWGTFSGEEADSEALTTCDRTMIAVFGSFMAAVPCDGHGVAYKDSRGGPVRMLHPRKDSSESGMHPVFLIGTEDGKYVVEGLQSSANVGVTAPESRSNLLLRVWDTTTASEVSQLETALNGRDRIGSLTAPKVSSACHCVLVQDNANSVNILRFSGTAGPSAQALNLVLPQGTKIRVGVFSHDGAQIILGTSDNTVILFNSRNGNEVRRFQQAGQIESIDMSRDGSKLVSAGLDQSTRVWDAATGRELARIPLLGSSRSVRFLKDGSKILTISAQESDFKKGRASITAATWESQASCADAKWTAMTSTNFVGSGKIVEGDAIITATVKPSVDFGIASTFDLKTSSVRGRVFSDDTFSWVALNNDGNTLATMTAFGKLTTWDTKTGDPTMTLDLHLNHLTKSPIFFDGEDTQLTFSESGQFLAIVRSVQDGGPLIVDIVAGKAHKMNPFPTGPSMDPLGASHRPSKAEMKFFDGPETTAGSLFNKAEDRLAFVSGGSDGAGLYSWGFTTDEGAKLVVPCRNEDWCALSATGERFVQIHKDSVSVFSPEGKLLNRYSGLPLPLDGRVLSPSGRYLMGDYSAIDLENGVAIAAPTALAPREESHPVGEGRFIVANGENVKVVNFINGVTSQLGVVTQAEEPVTDATGRYVAVGKNPTEVFDLENPSAKPLILKDVDRVAFSGDGGTIAGIKTKEEADFTDREFSREDGIQWWLDGKDSPTLSYNGDPISTLALDKAGTFVAIGFKGQANLVMGRVSRNDARLSFELERRIPIGAAAQHITFSSDSKYVAASAQNIVMIGSPSSPEWRKEKRPDKVTEMMFAPGKPYLASVTSTEVFLENVASKLLFNGFKSYERIETVALGDRGIAVASETKSGTGVELFAIDEGNQEVVKRQPFPVDIKSVGSMLFCPDGTNLAIASTDGVVYIWNTLTGNVTKLIHDSSVTIAGFAPKNDDYLMTVGRQSAYIWNWRTGAEVALVTPEAGLRAASFSANGRDVLTVADSGDTEETLWESKNLALVACERLGDSKPASCDSLGSRRDR